MGRGANKTLANAPKGSGEEPMAKRAKTRKPIPEPGPRSRKAPNPIEKRAVRLNRKRYANS